MNSSLLDSDLRLQRDLQQQIAQLLRQLAGVARVERVDDLVRLLDHEPSQRLVRLLAIPRTAVGRAQPSDDVAERVEAPDVDERRQRRDVDRSQVVRHAAVKLGQGHLGGGLAVSQAGRSDSPDLVVRG